MPIYYFKDGKKVPKAFNSRIEKNKSGEYFLHDEKGSKIIKVFNSKGFKLNLEKIHVVPVIDKRKTVPTNKKRKAPAYSGPKWWSVDNKGTKRIIWDLEPKNKIHTNPELTSTVSNKIANTSQPNKNNASSNDPLLIEEQQKRIISNQAINFSNNYCQPGAVTLFYRLEENKDLCEKIETLFCGI